MIGAWPSVIATSPAGPEAPVRATLWADHCPVAVKAFHRSPMTSSWHRRKPSPTPRICWTRGLAFNAHEVLEAAWKNCPDDERMLWQGLAQLAVGITHVQRGNVKGAMSLLRSASTRLSRGDRPARYAIDIAGLVNFVDALIDDLAAGVEIAPERLRPRLVVVEPGSR